MSKNIDVLLMLVAAFFTGFSVSLNNKANDKNKTFTQFTSEVLIHGISGSIIGALSTLYFDDILIVCAIAAIGGMFGQKGIQAIGNRFLKKYIPLNEKESNNSNDNCI